MATVSKWTPFDVALDITATGSLVTRTSATQFTVKINASWETYYNGAKTNYGMTASSGGDDVSLNTFGTAASSGSGTFIGTYSISGNGSATKTITVTFRNYNSDNGNSATKNVSFNVTVPAWTSYAITYNANGGSGAPGSQTKWKDQTLTLSSTKPTRTGHSFLGWSTSSTATSATYSAGGSYTANSAATLYAVWKANTYKVTYNANGGTGAPSAQTKTYGKTLTLSSIKPTRTNYNFKGWGTSASATTVSYAAGANYTANAAITLYAIWELAYVKPRVENVSIERCNDAGTLDDNGTYALISFKWACDRTVSSITVEFEDKAEGESTTYAITSSGTSGTVSQVVGDDSLSTETTYAVTIVVQDTIDSTYVFGTLAGTKFVIDFKAGGTGAAFGKPAELENVLDIGFKTRFFGGLLPLVLDPETDLNSVRTPNTYTGANIAHYNYDNCPVTNGTFTLIVESCGVDGQVRQTYISCSKVNPERFVRFYYQSEWGDWFWAGTEEYVLYENSSGSNGTITLNSSLANYRYVEIYFVDNNGKSGGYAKVWSPNGKTVCLDIVETSSASNVIQRQTMYTLSGTTMTPNTEYAGYVQFNLTQKLIANSPTGTNYIKIVRVIGRA